MEGIPWTSCIQIRRKTVLPQTNPPSIIQRKYPFSLLLCTHPHLTIKWLTVIMNQGKGMLCKAIPDLAQKLLKTHDSSFKTRHTWIFLCKTGPKSLNSSSETKGKEFGTCITLGCEHKAYPALLSLPKIVWTTSVGGNYRCFLKSKAKEKIQRTNTGKVSNRQEFYCFRATMISKNKIKSQQLGTITVSRFLLQPIKGISRLCLWSQTCLQFTGR